jgi:anthranilate phosphoribosyltransferase
LIWSPCSDPTHIITGFVHPPTEERFCNTFALRGVDRFTTIKGLEGSCDLPCSRTAIIGLGDRTTAKAFDRLLLDPRDYDLGGKDVPFTSLPQAIKELKKTIRGESSPLMPAAILNGGFYLWRCGLTSDLNSGFDLAKTMLTQGQVSEQIARIKSCL